MMKRTAICSVAVIVLAVMCDVRSAMIVAHAEPLPNGAQYPTSGIAPRTSFATFAVYIDGGEVPLAAYQFEFTAPAGAKIVGIEGGEHAAFQQPPYYDPAAMMNERLIAAAFSTAQAAALPAGRTRIATIHVQLAPPEAANAAEPLPQVRLTVAATLGGGRIPAQITIEQGVQP